MADKEEEAVTGTTTESTPKPEETTEVSSEPASSEDPASNLDTTSSDTNLTGNDAGTQAVTKDKTQIDILLKAAGNAPIMKKKKWTVSQDKQIGWICVFIKKYLKLDQNERLFLYINQTFAPAPDQTVKNLYDCYGTEGKLVIHYCQSQAWG